MSANNYIRVRELSFNKYDVSERDCERDALIEGFGIFNSLRLALKRAEKRMEEGLCEVEYGIRFSPLLESQIEAKDFDAWNIKKKHANKEVSRLYTKREIWWCRLGLNIGSEQDGSGEEFLRPIVIIRGFGPDMCMIIPLTTSLHKHPLRVPIGEIKGKQASALLSQIRVIDTRRLVEKVGFLNKDNFLLLRKAVRNLF